MYYSVCIFVYINLSNSLFFSPSMSSSVHLLDSVASLSIWLSLCISWLKCNNIFEMGQVTLFSELKTSLFSSVCCYEASHQLMKKYFINTYKMTKLAQRTESYQLDG